MPHKSYGTNLAGYIHGVLKEYNLFFFLSQYLFEKIEAIKAQKMYICIQVHISVYLSLVLHV